MNRYFAMDSRRGWRVVAAYPSEYYEGGEYMVDVCGAINEHVARETAYLMGNA